MLNSGFFVNCDPDLEVPREIENIVAWIVSRHVHPSEVGLVVVVLPRDAHPQIHLPHLPHAFTTTLRDIHVVCCQTEVCHGLHVDQCTASLISKFSQNLLKRLLRFVSSVMNFLCRDLKVSFNQNWHQIIVNWSTPNIQMKPENSAKVNSICSPHPTPPNAHPFSDLWNVFFTGSSEKFGR